MKEGRERETRKGELLEEREREKKVRNEKCCRRARHGTLARVKKVRREKKRKKRKERERRENQVKLKQKEESESPFFAHFTLFLSLSFSGRETSHQE